MIFDKNKVKNLGKCSITAPFGGIFIFYHYNTNFFERQVKFMSQKIVKIYEKVNGNYSLVNGKIVMPFNFGMLLDERLDEGYINLVGCSKDKFRPYTPFKVELYEDESLEKSIYFVLANDNGYEYPRGTNKYTHELYLIERTKWLEAFYCQSLVFTNTKGNVYTNNPAPALVDYDTDFDFYVSEIENGVKSDYVSPKQLGSTIIPFSAENLGKKIQSILNDYEELDLDSWFLEAEGGGNETKLVITNKDGTNTYYYNDEPPNILIEESISLVYTLVYVKTYSNGVRQITQKN